MADPVIIFDRQNELYLESFEGNVATWTRFRHRANPLRPQPAQDQLDRLNQRPFVNYDLVLEDL